MGSTIAGHQRILFMCKGNYTLCSSLCLRFHIYTVLDHVSSTVMLDFIYAIILYSKRILCTLSNICIKYKGCLLTASTIQDVVKMIFKRKIFRFHQKCILQIKYFEIIICVNWILSKNYGVLLEGQYTAVLKPPPLPSHSKFPHTWWKCNMSVLYTPGKYYCGGQSVPFIDS